MDSLNLSFIPSSVAEQWMLAQDAEEINLALEEIIDQYRGNYSIDNSGITSKNVLTLIKQILVKINLPDDALRLNCLRLLRLLAEDHAMVFEEVAFMVYAKIQILLQDHSRMIRTCALSLAAAISSRIPLYGIADNILTLVEERPPYRELSMKVASVAVLGFVKQCNGSKSSISDSHRRLLRAYIIRLASCASLEFSNKITTAGSTTDTNTTGGAGTGTASGSEDSKAIHHAAMDLLATSSLAIEELDNLVDQTLNTRAQSQQLALRSLLSSIAAHQAVAVLEVDNGTEREICRRMKNLDFPSLAEESTYSSIKPLLQHIIVKLNSVNEKKLALDKLCLGDNTAMKTSPRRENSMTTTHIETTAVSPRNSTIRCTTSKRVVPNIRKSWSNSSDLLPPDWEAPDTAPAGSLQFSPPKLGAAASPAAHYMRSSSQKGDAMLGEVDTSSEYAPSWSIQREATQRSGEKLDHCGVDRAAMLDRRAARPSRKFLQSDIEEENSLESGSRYSPLGAGSTASSFHSSGGMVSRSESNHSVQSYSVATSTSASVSNSFRDPTLASGRSSASSQDADDTNEAGKGEGKEFMGRSLRLLKSPHQRGRSDGSSTGPFSPIKHDPHRVFFSEDESPSPNPMTPRHMRSESGPDWLQSSSNEIHTEYDVGRKQNGASATESDAASTSRPTTNSQSFDSASKARLKRSRLKSANAAMNRVEESERVDSIAGEQGDSFSSSPHRGSKPPAGRTTLASKSDIGLTRHLSQDKEDRHHQNLNHSSEDIFPPSEDENVVITPSRLATGGRRTRPIHSPRQSLAAESGSLDLTEVTSLITKPDTTFDYVPSEELRPLTDPNRELSKAYRGLETQEWPEIFHTLTTYRRLALHHPAVITSAGTLHNTVQLIMKRVDELRSSLAKNAILTIEDFIKGLGKSMDAEIATVMPNILKRSIDSSSFLVESADIVLQAVVEYASLGRALPALLTHISHRSPAIRAKVAVCLHALIHSKGEELAGAKDFDGMKAALPKLLQDSAPEARAYSRETVRLLVQRRISTKVDLESHIATDLLEKVLREHTGQVYTRTVCSRTIAAPGSADYSLTSSSPMRANGRRTGRNVSSARSSAGSNSRVGSGGIPFFPATDRSLDSAGGGWSGTESGLDTPSKPERAPRVSRARQDLTPSRAILSNHNKTQYDECMVDSHDDYGRLRASSEHLSAQLDAHLSSPLPARASTSMQRKAAASGQSYTSSSSMSTTGASSTAASLATAAAAKRAIEQDPELCNLQEILASTTVSSWTARKDALDRVTELVTKNYDVLRDASKLSACVDCLLARLEDGSVKVHMHAISCLERVSEEEPLVLQHNLLQIVVPAVLGSATSTNKLISGKSVQLLRLLFDTTSPSQVAQYLCHTALHEKEKLRLTSLKFLSDVMPVFCADLDSIGSISKKIIFPTLCKILFASSTKGDQRVCATDCVRSLQCCLRAEKVWLWADDLTQQEELKRITATV